MKTVDQVVESMLEHEHLDPATRYMQVENAKARVLRAYPVVSLMGSTVRVTTPHPGYKEALKDVGFKFALGEWTRKCASTTEMLDVIRRIDAAIPDLLIQPGQEAILEKL